MMFSLNSKGTLSANSDLTTFFKNKQIEEVALARNTASPTETENDVFYCVYGEDLPDNKEYISKLSTLNVKYLGVKNTEMYKWNSYDPEEDGSIKFEVTEVKDGLLKLTRVQ